MTLRKTTHTHWLSPVNGLWSDGADWSDGSVPNSHSLVTIASHGSYTVTIAADAAAHGITLDDANATLLDNANLAIAGRLAITSGTFTLGATGTLTGGTLSATSAGTIDLSSGATLSGVTYDGALTVGGTLTVTHGLTLSDAQGGSYGTLAVSGDDANLILADTETLNSATVALGLSGDASITLDDPRSPAGQTLTLGPSLDLVFGGSSAGILNGDASSVRTGIINQGTITAGGPFGAYTIGTTYGTDVFGTFDNAGTIAVSNAATLAIAASDLINTGDISVTGSQSFLAYDCETTGFWTNQGIISVSDGGSLVLSGTFTSATLDSISLHDSELGIAAGLLLNSGTLSLADLTAQGDTLFLSQDGVIQGGTISDPNGTLFAYGGTLSGVTFQGTLTAYESLSIENGITFEGAGGSGEAAINVYSTLYVADDETLDNATLTFGNLDAPFSNGAILLGTYRAPPATLVLGPSLQLTAYAYTTISNAYNAVDSSLVNEGTFVASFGTLAIGDLQSFTNTGDVMVTNGGTATIAAPFVNQGNVTVSGNDTTLDLEASWSNTGQITMDAGTVELGGTFTLGALEAIVNDGGQIIVLGELENTGTLTVGPSLPFSASNFLGTIEGGVVSDSAGEFDINGGTLSGVTYQGTLSIGMYHTATIANGITMEGSGGVGPGTINIDGSTLTIAGSATLANTTLLYNSGQVYLQDQSTSIADTLQFAPSFVLGQGTNDLVMTSETTIGAVIINQAGAVETASGYVFLLFGGNIGSFTNAGTLDATQDGVITLAPYSEPTIDNAGLMTVSGYGSRLTADYGSLSNTGSIAISADGAASFIGNSFNNTGDISVTGPGSGLQIYGYGDGQQTDVTNSAVITVQNGASAFISLETFTNTGTISVSGSNSTLLIGSNWTNSGEIIDHGGTLDLGGTFTTAELATVIVDEGVINLEGDLDNAGATLFVGNNYNSLPVSLGGTITGGTIDETGNGFDSRTFCRFEAVTLNGAINLGMYAGLLDTGTQNGTITSAGLFDVDFGSLTVNGALTSSGTLELNTGTLIANGAVTSTGTLDVGDGSTLTLNQGATLVGVGNGGTIDAASGTVTISGNILGAGTLQIGSAATLMLSGHGDAQQQVDFTATTGGLSLASPTDFGGTIAGFGGSDTIDLLQLQANGVSFLNGVLDVTDNGVSVVDLKVLGNYQQGHFTLVSDGHGGSLIGFSR